jgi:hypothetical protein
MKTNHMNRIIKPGVVLAGCAAARFTAYAAVAFASFIRRTSRRKH